MNLININTYSKDMADAFSLYAKRFSKLPYINSSNIRDNETIFIIVDVINGFIRDGALHDKEIEQIIPPISEFLNYCKKNKIYSVTFSDCHSENALEFLDFPEHCVKGSNECRIVDELSDIGGFKIIEKNSANGFHTLNFQQLLKKHSDKKTYIVCGDCTDICVLNFCLSLKTYFNQKNEKKDIILPINMVETFESFNHKRHFANISALSILETNGIKLVGGIKINE